MRTNFCAHRKASSILMSGTDCSGPANRYGVSGSIWATPQFESPLSPAPVLAKGPLVARHVDSRREVTDMTEWVAGGA